ncbi:MAG: hypothetical protein O3B01_20540 [Planctomycetota bacterium]|nr:hypothetical protein [Planctomycetota bacterium]MDA1140961.1 hypothetical protein [Planctomycetota bacterium]
MNTNIIKTDGFSSPESAALFDSGFAADPEARQVHEAGGQCGGCSFFAPFNDDYGLCCHYGSDDGLKHEFNNLKNEVTAAVNKHVKELRKKNKESEGKNKTSP